MKNLISALVVTPLHAAVVNTTVTAVNVTVNTTATTANRPTVEVHYESHCPDSISFFQSYLGAVTNPRSERYWKKGRCNLKLFPYGKVSASGDCQHGWSECYANRMHACLLDGSNSTIVDFRQSHDELKTVYCMMARSSNFLVLRKSSTIETKPGHKNKHHRYLKSSQTVDMTITNVNAVAARCLCSFTNSVEGSQDSCPLFEAVKNCAGGDEGNTLFARVGQATHDSS